MGQVAGKEEHIEISIIKDSYFFNNSLHVIRKHWCNLNSLSSITKQQLCMWIFKIKILNILIFFSMY